MYYKRGRICGGRLPTALPHNRPAVIPIGSLAEERKTIDKRKAEDSRELVACGEVSGNSSENDSKSRWTIRLIGNLSP